ncbi:MULTISPECIES: hypothetical protein [unclassified Streptomyces]|uniref:hypothetical protein n=1 Tax=unclassified Streptomyces TaxID=2593676 RepID=UPI001906FAC8|nr:hypothetical protein [Streptomyces sp. HSG2]
MNETCTAAGPGVSGMGVGSFSNPGDIPASGLRYAVALPFYQRHGIYIEDAGKTIEVKGGAHELTIEETRSTTQTIPLGGGGDDWRSTIRSVVGIAVRTAENALRRKYPYLPDGAIFGLLGFGESSADSVSKQDRVTFGVRDKIKITPLIGKTILARPVYFKVKSVSDEWVRDPGGGWPRLVRGSVVSDAVVKMGWILECPAAGGRVRMARQMPSNPKEGVEYDYMADTMLTIPAPPDPEVDECAPPTGPPDRMDAITGENSIRWHFSGPQESTVKSLGDGMRREDYRNPDRAYLAGISVRCPPPKYQEGSRTYECYRIEYHIEGTSAASLDWSWGDRSKGTLSFADGVRKIAPWESDPKSMAQHRGIPADGGEYEYDLKFNAFVDFPSAAPRLRVCVIPVK